MVAKLHAKDPEFFQRRPDTVLTICQFLAPLMNEVHETEFSKKFWTRLLIPYAWAYYNQQEYYERPDARYPVPFQPMTGWAPSGTIQIAKDRLTTTFKSFTGRYSLNSIGQVIADGDKLAVGIRGEIIAGELDAKFVSFNWVPFLRLSDRQPRRQLLSLTSATDRPVGRMIVKQMPKIYLEYLGGLLKLLQRAGPLTVSDIYVEHHSSFFDRILSCYLGEKGASINQLQTGGYVGETTQSVDAVKRAKWDKHLTYGWRINPEDTPFYGIRLEEFRKRYCNHWYSEKALDLLIVYDQVNSDRAREYYKYCTSLLYDNVDLGQYQRIMLRPRGSTRRLSARKSLRFLQVRPRIQIGSGKDDIAQLCASSRLVIHWSHPSTNFLECIFVDQPVMAVQLNSSPTDIVKPHYEFLQAVGVLHEDPQALVTYLRRIDVERWWDSVIHRKEYQSFKRTFVRSKAEYFSEQSGPGMRLASASGLRR